MVTTYQDVVQANLPTAAWALTEASGTDYIPYYGNGHLLSSGTLDYRQTGPFGSYYGLHLRVAATLRTTGITFMQAPTTVEFWAKLDAVPPGSTTLLWFWGSSGGTGTGIYVDNANHIFFYGPPAAAVDTGLLWTAGWHLVQSGNPGASGGTSIALDGAIRWSHFVSGTGNGSPDNMYFGSSGSGGAATALTVSMPAIYNSALTASLAKSTFLASTDPAAAMAYTITNGATQNDLLNQILASVRKSY